MCVHACACVCVYAHMESDIRHTGELSHTHTHTRARTHARAHTPPSLAEETEAKKGFPSSTLAHTNLGLCRSHREGPNQGEPEKREGATEASKNFSWRLQKLHRRNQPAPCGPLHTLGGPVLFLWPHPFHPQVSCKRVWCSNSQSGDTKTQGPGRAVQPPQGVR